MGVFSKLFSRENAEAQDHDASAASVEGGTVVKDVEEAAERDAGREDTRVRVRPNELIDSSGGDRSSKPSPLSRQDSPSRNAPPIAAPTPGSKRKQADKVARSANERRAAPQLAELDTRARNPEWLRTLQPLPIPPLPSRIPPRGYVDEPDDIPAVNQSQLDFSAAQPDTDDADLAQLGALVDAAVDALFDGGVFDPSLNGDDDSRRDSDREELEETFAGIAKLHAHPLRELMGQLALGRTPRTWVTACRPMLLPLLDAASQIGLSELGDALRAFDAALARAADGPTPYISDAATASLQVAYERLSEQLPDAFGSPDQGDERRLVLLESLLLQVPSLQRRTLSKLYAAGLSSLAQLSQAQPEDLTAVAGLEHELARAIIARSQHFEQERNQLEPAAVRGHLRLRLRTVVKRLARLQAEFERADQEDSSERKKAARRAREATVLELHQHLAELGDVPLIEELKRYPVRGKLRRMEIYLQLLQTSD